MKVEIGFCAGKHNLIGDRCHHDSRGDGTLEFRDV